MICRSTWSLRCSSLLPRAGWSRNSGCAIARRSRRCRSARTRPSLPRSQEPPRRLNEEYLKGLGFLLNEEPDKALEVFLRMVDVDNETVETHFALGTIYRRRGEVERAIRIHENIMARPSLSNEHRLEAMFALAEDYFRAGPVRSRRALVSPARRKRCAPRGGAALPAADLRAAARLGSGDRSSQRADRAGVARAADGDRALSLRAGGAGARARRSRRRSRASASCARSAAQLSARRTDSRRHRARDESSRSSPPRCASVSSSCIRGCSRSLCRGSCARFAAATRRGASSDASTHGFVPSLQRAPSSPMRRSSRVWSRSRSCAIVCRTCCAKIRVSAKSCARSRAIRGSSRRSSARTWR